MKAIGTNAFRGARRIFRRLGPRANQTRFDEISFKFGDYFRDVELAHLNGAPLVFMRRLEQRQ